MIQLTLTTALRAQGAGNRERGGVGVSWGVGRWSIDGGVVYAGGIKVGRLHTMESNHLICETLGPVSLLMSNSFLDLLGKNYHEIYKILVPTSSVT